VSTLSWFGREFEKIYAHIQVNMKIDIEERAVPQRLKVTIFRVMQEALNNVAKHSGSEAATISLSNEDGRIELVIQDDGQGFDVEGASPGKGSSKGFGLTSMKERIEMSGGSFSIESGTGEGTRVRAVWKSQPPERS
jgi:signal transduction histidine kinase